MDHAGPVRGLQRSAQLSRQQTQRRHRQRPGGRQAIGEIAARVQLHHQEQQALVLDQIVDAHDVGMADPAHHLHLASKAIGDHVVEAQVGIQDLQRHLGAAGLIEGGHHLGDAPLPQPPHDAVPPAQQ
jgi:hypothetical protein